MIYHMDYSRKRKHLKRRKSLRGGEKIYGKQLSYGDLDFSMSSSPLEPENAMSNKRMMEPVKPKVPKEIIDFSTPEIEEIAVARPPGYRTPSPIHTPYVHEKISRNNKKMSRNNKKMSRNNKNKNKISRNKRPAWRPAGPIRYPH